MRTPDITLDDTERELLDRIDFRSRRHDDLQSSLGPMEQLARRLLDRDAIPAIRIAYFTDPDFNIGGRGRSRADVFAKNGTVGEEILAHGNFLKHLEYFVFGPDLPEVVIRQFKEAALESGHLTGSDVVELLPIARAWVRSSGANAHDASEEFFKLAIECGASPSSAATLRTAVRSVKAQ